MLDWLRRLSKSSKPEELFLSLDEARNRFEEKSSNILNQVLEECKKNQDEISERFKILSDLLQDLKGKRVEETRAIGSEIIKNRFVNSAISVIEKFRYEKIADIDDANKFIRDLSDVINKINVTPKQAMHLNFFFEKEMGKIAAVMDEIIKKNEDMRQKINLEIAKINNIKDLFSNLHEIENTLVKNRENLERIENEINNMKKKIEELKQGLHDLRDLDILRERLLLLLDKGKHLSQMLDSELAVARLLRKFRYHAKENKAILDMYINSPHEAFMLDRDILIRDILMNAILLVKDGKITIEKSTIKKVENLLANLDELVKIREEAIAISEEIDNNRNKISSLLPKEEYNKKVAREIASLSERIERLEVEKNRIVSYNPESEINQIKIFLKEKLSEFLGVEINLE